MAVRPRPSAAPLATPANSASPELKAMSSAESTKGSWRASLSRAPLRKWMAERAGTRRSRYPHTRGGGPHRRGTES
eukprot:4623898-Alexandrium_andersonii.AAC.1